MRAVDSLGEDGADIPLDVVISQTHTGHDIDALIANVQRADLTPVEEAQAFFKLMAAGHTERGVADTMGVSLARVTQRLQILELPQKCIDAIDAGDIPLSAVPALKKMARVSPQLAIRATVKCRGKAEPCAILAKEPDRIAYWLGKEEAEPFYVTDEMWTGAKVSALKHKDATKVANLIEESRVSQNYDPDFVRFSDEDVDQLTALGGVYPLPNTRTGKKQGLATDVEALLVQLEQIALRTRTENEERAKARAARQPEAPPKMADLPKDEQERVREERAKARAEEMAQRTAAREYNLALGRAFQMQLARQPLTAMTAQLVVDAVLENMDLGSLGRRGLRYVLEQAQKVVDQGVGKDGAKKPDKIEYPSTKADNAKLVRSFMAGAKTPEEKLGRLVVVLAAAELADENAVAESARDGRTVPGNPDIAGTLGIAAIPPGTTRAKAMERFERRHEEREAAAKAEEERLARMTPAERDAAEQADAEDHMPENDADPAEFDAEAEAAAHDDDPSVYAGNYSEE